MKSKSKSQKPIACASSLDRVLALAMRWGKHARLYHSAGERSSDPLRAIAQTLRNCADELRAAAKKLPNPNPKMKPPAEMKTTDEILAEWKALRDAFRRVAELTPATLLPGSGWDVCVRVWDDFDRLINHMEKTE